MADRPGGRDAPRAVLVAVVVGAVAVAVALLLLWVDLRHRAAVEDGRPLAPHVVVVTPAPYGPPDWFDGREVTRGVEPVLQEEW